MGISGFYFITDAGLSRAGNLSDVKNALAAGVSVVQYRNKCLNTREMFFEAQKLRRICKKITFIINDRVDIALAVNADGVHLGNNDLSYQAARRLLGKKKLIGLTVHTPQEARRAQELGADYLGVSAIFPTQTKPDAGKPAGVTLIKKVKAMVNLPVIAIGGINLGNAGRVLGAGADGLCAISAVVTKPDVKKEIQKFQKLFLQKKGEICRRKRR
jgi:thiamine-phosphate pyrophosphorylase